MAKAGLLDRVGEMFGIVRAAGRAAAAVEARRAPSPRDLKTLGIDPATFGSIER